ncbi:sulfatase family protein [Arthrobacter bambusae]|uniref:sulfatase family protein n=1 Tax=Arthrobacter bambusae TaxID=1338426 RepID=UPI002786C1EE|nr:sulfatase [Arthrobacter bambusae]MDQ0242146.1 putative sulfatase [Arthrobacter bambusae]
MNRPNILWISTHDINPHLGAYAGVYPGAEYAVTPNLNRLAEEGMRFDNAFAAAPICAPSRSAIMTGCFPTSIGTMHMRTKAVPPPEVRLFTEYFREAGYYVTNNSFTDFQVPTPTSAFDDCSDTAHWRNRPDDSTPFFATFHGMATHESQIYLPEEEFSKRTAHVQDQDRHDPSLAPLPPYYPDTPVFRCSWARYNDLITEMDHWVGTILDQLEEDGLAGNTIVVFWSDHGLGMPRGKRWLNDSGLHEPLIIRWPDRIKAGSINTNLAHLMDLAPTMLQLCGIQIPTHVHAKPLLAADGTQIDQPNAYVYAARDRMGELEDMSRSVRDSRYRYIRHFHPDRGPMPHCDYPDHLDTWRELRILSSGEAGQRAKGLRRSLLTPLQRTLVAPAKPEEELFDLLEDPHETTNLAGQPRFDDTLARFRVAVANWQDTYGDLGLIPEDDLLEQWRPSGVWPQTAAPSAELTDSGVQARSTTEGAHVVWTADPPTSGLQRPGTPADRMGSPADAIGAPPQDGRTWKMLCEATPPPEDCEIWIKACRLGYLESEETAIPSHWPAPDALFHH